ncbi:ABC-2 transporter permease [Faecalicatena sp. AGMB00832]|uniref:ABC-2 transporter permease n=1 Tax=Faecalicatena faecalis TaxID=2726362 RepID=A0ABS6D1Y8_9FIRM|nr:ABC-2 transporter permease [Faecalicatena faecalis]MBU3875519.1 ABC-2 transporter permease [Faecalicatena faecalis]
MKGLLIKDFKLLKSQTNFFITIFIIGILLMVMQGSPIIPISYGTLMFSMFTLSTISYDEFDNCNAFLFTLPVTRKQYVLEKYVFGILVAVIPWAVSTGISVIYQTIKNPGEDLTELLISAPVMLCFALVFLGLTLPVQLKFGADKGRMAMFGVMGVIVVIGFVIGFVLKSLGIPLEEMISNLTTMGLAGLLGAILTFCAVLWVISYSVSLKIIVKKQF